MSKFINLRQFQKCFKKALATGYTFGVYTENEPTEEVKKISDFLNFAKETEACVLIIKSPTTEKVRNSFIEFTNEYNYLLKTPIIEACDWGINEAIEEIFNEYFESVENA